MKEKILVIVGPTAVGKTALSLELAKTYHGEIISGDSMQIYRHLSIGTAKIKPEDMQHIPHHLIDFLEPNESYSASQFQAMAQEKIADIIERGNLPIVVGGTGLYIEGLLRQMSFGGENSYTSNCRLRLQERVDKEGIECLYQELSQKDPKAAQHIHINNPRRIIRALEVIEQTGQLFSEQCTKERYDAFIIGLTTCREYLYERINQRVDMMMEQGLLQEAEWLFNQHYPDNTQSLKAIGYKELFPYLQQEATLEDCVEVLKRNSRRYAKRQLTWFRNRMSVRWFDCLEDDKEILFEEVDAWLKKLS
ncbi:MULTISPECIES: tRNA (adenosine(37)-N6)-dimethylallyltransferase MiaA [unclassified Granulicatella]|uniref:tRNA (adenosine(37)-N6)-dimethylallyltransferase MiaA n=1 Tax=unclassified Granulicatella TaxID=2630493 RepID=UPI00107331AC|nr:MULTISPECIES: tRNA (adenosine(37)-N6)-dimethylallyltransferase MiaA [unclassified Granulicatella]MBF0780224.1 tRNA (adenosine(37)-N6)-dimethylallyltransferase MiaA [Granulicatella sp. 19428wC4_WM01]TFU95658.1 tRNA (adenosine(37)-N6)-dimethylallyltransferase MiaA [Granulicatella sp. WM01]